MNSVTTASGSPTAYLHGANLIRSTSGNTLAYYLYNAHGEVVRPADSSGAVSRTYTYDAFGNELSPDAADANPSRYCGEYFDAETDSFYLRARYYDPLTGRFSQQDQHWNAANMIYGDHPQKIHERQDQPGLTH